MQLNILQIIELLRENLIMIVDTREQKTHIWEKYLVNHPEGVYHKKLEFGDYTFGLKPNEIIGNTKHISFENLFVVERKSGKTHRGGGFGELRSNLIGENHQRFKREFERAISAGCNEFYLLIENASSVRSIKKLPVYKQPVETFEKAFNTFITRRNNERQENGLEWIKIIYSRETESCIKIQNAFLKFFARWIKSR